MSTKPAKITDLFLRKLVGIPGETQKITIGAGLAGMFCIGKGLWNM